MKKILFLFVLLFSFLFTFSQNISVKLIDKNNKNPIPYATIKTGEFSGVISNEEGYFTINLDKNELETISISCLGYQNITVSIQNIKASNFIIELDEAINQLNEVYISNKKHNADSIIAKVRAKVIDNYKDNLFIFNIFRRNTKYANFKNLDFEIEKASQVRKKNLEDANTNLSALSKKITESNVKHFTEIKGKIYSKNYKNSKTVVEKASKLIDHKNDFSIENIQEKAQSIVLKYLDTTKTYKLKTGFFKIEDSLSIKDENLKDEQKNEFNLSELNKETRALLNHTQFYSNSFLDKIINANLYKYTFDDITYNDGGLTYKISFEPKKSKSKYTGTLFISDKNFAITQIAYKYFNNRHGDKFNLKLLLGVKYMENVSEGLIIFEQNANYIYQPKYLKQTTGSYFYVNRDLKFIENSPAKNKVSFSFKIEGDARNKEELLFTGNFELTNEDYAIIKQPEVAPYTILKKFEKSIWQNENIIEPLQEMKSFNSED
ncbi:MAG: hypothetical protein HKO01_06020 [Flaviramulus sp.]|nr:carboxypeptidase-like regulatory domain-containing protein [Flaviramulus sp.]NNC50075.1 hypothetical protein [Flaviramulus sp.]